ncbi:MAG TPA: MarR family transcriptional regulator [Ktedonosporobacter sp.]|nr:MarR family transcriptional regulator [Ktedonosporobacter sp.]
MERTTNPTEVKLMRAFMQFGRAEWHQRSIAGCKPSEIRVLFCIKKGLMAGCHGMKSDDVKTPVELKVSDISRLLHVTSPTVTQLLKGLEANGLVERHIDPTDRRSVGITLTRKGEQVTQQAADAFSDSFHGLMEFLGEDESNELADLLFKVSRYYHEQSAVLSSWNGEDEL